MGKSIYLRLAAQNIKNNRRTYVPYMLTGIFTVAMFYIMNFMALNKGLDEMEGSSQLKLVLGLGVWVIGIFAAIFLFYTNSFLIKRRKKELGLYNILGMEKKHIAIVLFLEMLLVIVSSLVIGNLLGVLSSKLMFLVLLKLLQHPVPLGFEVSFPAMFNSFKIFIVIYLLAYFNNLRQVHLASPAELLRGGNVGEREPKSKWILALLGVALLGAAYYIAVVTESPMEALNLFFVAVIMVMVGTYLLFTAVSIVLLKYLRSNKKFYYKLKHFTSVSGMIYRMKQNAVGLANICILSTAVLVMISGTLCLYAGREDILYTRFPKEVIVSAVNLDEEGTGKLEDTIDKTLKEYNLSAVGGLNYRTASEPFLNRENYYEKMPADVMDMQDADKITRVYYVPLEDYNAATGKSVSLNSREALLYINTKKAYGKSSITLGDERYEIKEELEQIFVEEKMPSPVMKEIYLVVDSLETVMSKARHQDGELLYYINTFDLSGDEALFLDFEHRLSQAVRENAGEDCMARGREADRGSSMEILGGFLFLGIFLGTLFLMATAMIIYYKQVSEGMDDKERFQIMQKVGMSRKEVRSSIRSQVLTVFFLPLLMAVVHICFAFPMITKLLASFSMFNTGLFVLCTLVTVAVFALAYGIIYGLTARVYYRIVN